MAQCKLLAHNTNKTHIILYTYTEIQVISIELDVQTVYVCAYLCKKSAPKTASQKREDELKYRSGVEMGGDSGRIQRAIIFTF